MNTANYVAGEIQQMKIAGTPIGSAVWATALLCVEWPYVFGAWGAECTPAERRKRYSDAHPTIKTKCQVLNGSRSSCSGCKWYPNEERVRCFDCRGFTDWCLKQFGIDLKGDGATSQWNTASNWSSKGEIASIPEDTLVCLFVKKGAKMEHTGFGFHGETCECSSGVQHFTTRNKKWTHWAVPNGIEGSEPIPTPTPEPTPTPTPTRPTLRRGSKGEYVVELQTILQKLGYDLGSLGIDGDYGRMTQSAVMNFQSDHGLNRDGICGPKTWEKILDAADTLRPVDDPLYTVHVPHLTVYQTEALLNQYTGAYKTAEE